MYYIYNVGSYRLMNGHSVYKVICYGLIKIYICKLIGTQQERLIKFHKIANGSL
jgi:hypothetical protein